MLSILLVSVSHTPNGTSSLTKQTHDCHHVYDWASRCTDIIQMVVDRCLRGQGPVIHVSPPP